MRSELSPFSIDRKIINTLLQLMKERDYLESVLPAFSTFLAVNFI